MKKRADGRYVETATIDGKRKFFYGTSPAEVKRKMRDYDEKLEAGRTFREVAEEWETEHLTKLKYNTQEFYKASLRRAKEEFGAEYTKQITPRAISQWLGQLAAQGLGKRTVTAHLTVINMVCARAVIAGDIDINPAREVTVPRNLTTEKRELPPDNFIKIVDSHPEGDGLLPFLLLWTGCRRCEALALTWDDIDFTNKKISINKIVERHSNQPVVRKGAKTEAGMRTIIMADRLAAALEPAKGAADRFIFGGTEPWTDTKFRRTWERYCRTYGMTFTEIKKIPDKKSGKEKSVEILKPALSPHQLRHAYVTMLYEAGIDEKTAMSQTGHADEKTIRDIYTHLRKKKANEAAEKLNKFSWL